MTPRIIKISFVTVTIAVCFCSPNKSDTKNLHKNNNDTVISAIPVQTEGLRSIDSLSTQTLPNNDKSDDERVALFFVGYDGKTPIFCPTKGNVIYKYVDGRLTKIDVFAPSDTRLSIVKNGIYVFKKEVDTQTARYYLKKNGKEVVTHLDINHIEHLEEGQAMNDEYFFIRGEENNRGTTIFSVNYRVQAKIDTFQLNEYCSSLLDADSNYLYYVDYTPHEAGREGSLYRMDIKTGASDVVVGNTENVTESMALVTPLNLLYVHGKIVDYNKELIAVSPDKSLRYNGVGIFYSYEHKAFIISDWTMDINKWRILRLEDIREWKPYSEAYKAYKDATGPWAVPLIKQCEHDRCTTGVARAYREKTGCTDISDLSGNQMFDYLVKMSMGPQSIFKEVKINETYTLADKGYIVIAAQNDTKDHGHVTLIVPGKSGYEEYWQKDQNNYENIYLPFVKDTGPKNPIEKQLISDSYEPRRQKDVKFFVYTGPGCKK